MARKVSDQELQILKQQAIRAGADPKLVEKELNKLTGREKPGLIGSLVNQFMGLPRLGAEAVFQGARTLTDPAFMKASMGGQLTPQEAEHILRQQPTKFVPMEEIATPGKIAETAARRTAGTASFFVPGGKTVKGAMALGGLAGGMSAFGAGGGLKEVAKGAALGGALGGATKWATGKWAANKATKARQAQLREQMLGGEAGETARKTTTLGKMSRSLERGSIKPELGAGKGLFAKSRSERALNHLDKAMQEYGEQLGIVKGGPGATLDNLEMMHKMASTDVQKILVEAPDIPFKELDKRLVEAMGDFVDENGDLIFDSPSSLKIIQNDLRKLHKLIQGDDTVNALSLNQFKTELQNKINKVFRAAKGDTVAQLTEKEEARYAMREAIDDVISTFVPAAKEKTFMQSSLNDLSTGAWKAYTQSQRIPLVGLQSRGLQQAIFGANAKASRFFNFLDDKTQQAAAAKTGATQAVRQKVGEAVSSVAKRAPQWEQFHKWAVSFPPPTKLEFAGRVAAGEMSKPEYQTGGLPGADMAGTGLEALTGEPKSDAELELEKEVQKNLDQNMSADGLWQWNGAGWIPTKEHIELAALKDMQKSGGKNLAKLETMANFFGIEFGTEGAQANLDADAKKKLRSISTLEGLLPRYYNMLQDVGLEDNATKARLYGSIRKLGIPLGLNTPELLTFDRVRRGTVALVAKSLGEVGNLSEPEQQRALELIPDVNMSQAEVEQNLLELQNIIATAKDRILTGADIEVGEAGSDLSGMMGLGGLAPEAGLPITPGMTP